MRGNSDSDPARVLLFTSAGSLTGTQHRGGNVYPSPDEAAAKPSAGTVAIFLRSLQALVT
eukprot:5049778-Amphidinium_carterae.1